MPNGRRSSQATRMSRTIIQQAKASVEAQDGGMVPAVLLQDRRFLQVKRLNEKARTRKLVTIATR